MTRITFIAMGIDPGKNGVGDYTRLLADTCAQAGHKVHIIALQEPSLEAPEVVDFDPAQKSPGYLRLPAKLSWPERIETAKQYLADQETEWVSIQFVPYGFHPKGFVNQIAPQLLDLRQGYKLHLMLHELWIGDDQYAALKDRVYGWLQRRQILRLLAQLDADVMQTSNPTYVRRLKLKDIEASQLPLFGNMPITSLPPKGKPNWLQQTLMDRGLLKNTEERHQWWLGGVFGALHPEWEPPQLIEYLLQAAATHQKRLMVLWVGREGRGKSLWQRLEHTYGDRLTFCRLGEQSPEHISQFLQALDFGISTTPNCLIEKSGTAVSMQEHGLPLLVPRDDFITGYDPQDPIFRRPHVYRVADILQRDFATLLTKTPPESRLPGVARQFLAAIDVKSKEK